MAATSYGFGFRPLTARQTRGFASCLRNTSACPKAKSRSPRDRSPRRSSLRSKPDKSNRRALFPCPCRIERCPRNSVHSRFVSGQGAQDLLGSRGLGARSAPAFAGPALNLNSTDFAQRFGDEAFGLIFAARLAFQDEGPFGGRGELGRHRTFFDSELGAKGGVVKLPHEAR